MNRIIDTKIIADSFSNKAAEYDSHIIVQKRVVAQLVASIESHLKDSPSRILDVGTGTGNLLGNLRSSYPDAAVYGVDIAPNMCRLAQQKLGESAQIMIGDAVNLPFGTEEFDLIVSSSALQWVENLAVAVNEMRRVLKPGGSIYLAFFCDGTLSELHSCFRDVLMLKDSSSTPPLSRLHDFRTVDQVNAILKRLDLEQFVVTVETEVDWYDDLNSLLRSIKNIGAGSVTGGSVKGLGWRGIFSEISRLYYERFGQNGRIPATYRVLYLTASVSNG
ncbi:MAG: methyltransferase domain-containing protein [Desulfuromonadaceae bacterium]|nr:methyltransferase domain-containing protein [Desulfuromonadaceae bacterium]